jgi:hypothetical protein
MHMKFRASYALQLMHPAVCLQPHLCCTEEAIEQADCEEQGLLLQLELVCNLDGPTNGHAAHVGRDERCRQRCWTVIVEVVCTDTTLLLAQLVIPAVHGIVS